MATLFTKIVKGEIPSYKVAENENFYAFLDINPLAKGHTLVIPKKEIDYIFDMQDEELSSFICFAKNSCVLLFLAIISKPDVFLSSLWIIPRLKGPFKSDKFSPNLYNKALTKVPESSFVVGCVSIPEGLFTTSIFSSS